MKIASSLKRRIRNRLLTFLSAVDSAKVDHVVSQVQPLINDLQVARAELADRQRELGPAYDLSRADVRMLQIALERVNIRYFEVADQARIMNLREWFRETTSGRLVSGR